VGANSGRLKDSGAFARGRSAIGDGHSGGRGLNRKGRKPMAGRESDRLIVLEETVGPFTWGRGRREHAADKGNTYRI
jgi:hypothetical protein